MIRLIYGAKGSGKTGKIIDDANAYFGTCSGDVVFLTDTDKYMHRINYNIRLINVTEYDIVTDIGLSGFIRGIIAGNHDVVRIYVDGVHRMTNKKVEELQSFFDSIFYYAQKHQVEMVLTISVDELPIFLSQYEKEKA